MSVFLLIILLFLSILPVFLLGRYIYKTDFEKEPTGLLVGLFFMGIGSIAVTLVITLILSLIIPFFAVDESSLNLIELIPYIYIGVALVEEFSKWIFVYAFAYHHYEFNHAYDAIVYAVFVSLGFACLENIMYVFNSGITTAGISTAIMRAITAVPGHACFGVLSGYYLGLAKTADKHQNREISKKNKIKSLLIPILGHGTYDYLIFGSTQVSAFIFIFIGFVVFLFTNTTNKVKQLSKIHFDVREGTPIQPIVTTIPRPIPETHEYRYCPMCGETVVGNFCAKCGYKHMK